MGTLLSQSDGTLLEVVARELERLAGGSPEYRGGPVGMAAQLIRTIDGGDIAVAPAPDRDVDVERLKAYLVEAGLISAEASLSPQRSALGFSKDTYLVEVNEPGRAPATVVIRRDLPAGPTRSAVADEFLLLRAAYEHGLAVAEPLLIETRPEILGRPFLLTRGAAGRPDYTKWATDPAERAAVADQLAVFLARLHTLPTDEAPVRRLAPGASPRGELLAHFREWRGFWEEGGRPGFEQIAEAYSLIENDIPDLERLAVVHSDVGFHNILVDQGRITAVLDWEFSHLGEPEEDLAYARQSIEALTSWEGFLEAYSAAGGLPISAARVRAYEIWRGVRNATCCALGRKAFESGLNTDLRLAYAGRVLLKSFADDVARLMARAD